jgi:predicted SAM-dependent methyltransferase
MSGIRLNLGCGGRPLADYYNVDMNTLEQLRQRYPTQVFPENTRIYPWNIFQLPFKDGSVAEIRCDALIEHLSFAEESKFFFEVGRVLKTGGLLRFMVPDLEQVLRLWLEAKDDWKEFFRNDDEAIRAEHWFGQNSYTTEQRWGYLTAVIFGSQNGEGQYHKNGYTEQKILNILSHLNFELESLTRERWKGDREFVLSVMARRA